jgi:uncharacterized membrane protein
MTLGPGLLLLTAFEHARGRLANAIITFGRVPLFFYVLHIFVIHACAAAMTWFVFGSAGWLFGQPPKEANQRQGGYNNSTTHSHTR